MVGHTCLSCTKHLTGSQNVKTKVKLKNIPSRFAYFFGGWSHGESPGKGTVLAARVYDLSHIRTKPDIWPVAKAFPNPKPATSQYAPVTEVVIGAYGTGYKNYDSLEWLLCGHHDCDIP